MDIIIYILNYIRKMISHRSHEFYTYYSHIITTKGETFCLNGNALCIYNNCWYFIAYEHFHCLAFMSYLRLCRFMIHSERNCLLINRMGRHILYTHCVYFIYIGNMMMLCIVVITQHICESTIKSQITQVIAFHVPTSFSI